ncbi:hypothetical protein LVB87_01485 [Lysobacter sp. KIS68-7]|uniref:hypothetical protein n=1 Tax=Lysobacter sp. KIS68-7 TaxID=2904252 RepID=UPI001E2C4C44|nr:hypothetical protein [Lysobacter sp. KIS68-7]UHQ19866.1 hypothetical protein LVB87_01485 [Lysobacter sp. KIS68-7]
MSLRKLTRVALHLVLVLSMGLAGVMAPVSAAKEAMASIPGAAPMDMPCAEMGAMQQAPSHDPAAKAHCSLAVCLGAAACLPEMPRMTAHVPSAGRLDIADVPFVPSGVLDTPLRPPIA